jgi:hypothetical protein
MAGHRILAIDQVECVEHPARHRVGQAPGRNAAQRLGHPVGQLPGAQLGLLGLGVDGQDPPGAVADQVDDRVGQLPGPAELVDLAVEHRLGAGGQLALPPGLVEERHLHRAAAVGHPRLDQRPAAPHPAP